MPPSTLKLVVRRECGCGTPGRPGSVSASPLQRVIATALEEATPARPARHLTVVKDDLSAGHGHDRPADDLRCVERVIVRLRLHSVRGDGHAGFGVEKTISASAPIAIVPFFGHIPKSFAGFVEDMRPAG